MPLPRFQAMYQPVAQDFNLLQTTWSALLDPLLKKPQNSSNILESVPLVIGSNTVNHKLGRKLQGWSLTRQRAAASIYDTQDSNPTPDLTLVLVSSAVVTVNIEVF